ncbi:MAG: metal-dependent hydrolase [Psittacicella sp.]
MTGSGHLKTGIAFSTAVILNIWLLTNNSFFAISAAVTCILGAKAPDYLELRKKGGGTIIPHRTITHWVLMWVLVFLSFDISIRSFSFWGGFNYSILIQYLCCLGYGYAFGGIVHLLGDFPNKQGIPFLLPKSTKFALYLWNSGKHESAIISVSILVSALYILLKLGILSINY